MATPPSPELTQILADASRGDEDAANRLFPLIYDELHRLAQRYLRRERPDHTLQATALVHEAYLKLLGQRNATWAIR